MKILYDLIASQPNISGKTHGGGNYAILVFKELINRNINIECVFDSHKELDKDVIKLCNKIDIKIHDINEYSIDEIILNGNYDIFYSALPLRWINIKNNSILFIGTEHGLRDIEMPKDKYFFKYNISLKQIIRYFIMIYFNHIWKKREKSKIEKLLKRPNFKFITVSNHTKYSFLSYFPYLKSENISVFNSPDTTTNYLGEPYSNKKYFLLVSGNRPEKNNLRAIIALDELFSERKELSEYHVYIAGGKINSYHYKIINKSNFTFLDYVDKQTLNSLYKGAYCFIYPSLNEGFGYPPLEAMSFGIPVISSPISSISEVCGDAAIYFNPFDHYELKGRILQLILDHKLYQTLQNKGVRRYNDVKINQKNDLKEFIDWLINMK